MLRLCLFVYGILFAISMLSYFHLSIAMNNETERLALLEIKAQISDPLGVMNSWNNTLHYCKWYGVTCGGKLHGVTKLDLHSSNLSGIISPHLGNLTFLKELNIETNMFHGKIPSEIDHLHMLHSVRLFDNIFDGKIPPNISNCKGLININFSRNNFEGEIPPSLGSLSNLKFLSLRKNNFTGNIPESLGNLSSLSIITIADNYLFGLIPNSLGKLKNLTSLRLANNNFHGLVPNSIYNLSLLTELSLQQNQLIGTLPSNLGITLPSLHLLYMGVNQFSGQIPYSISNLSNLEFLQFNQNNLRGKVPSLHKLAHLSHLVLFNNSLGYNKPGDLDFVSSMRNATRLQWLEIDHNNFNGVFPDIICNFSSLTSLTLRYNNIAGEIPSCIKNLGKLEQFLITNNRFSGVIPESIGNLQNLYLLFMHQNQFSGKIPLTIGNLTRLSYLYLSQNKLEGQIPSTLGNCTSLNGLYLANNSLSGNIPPQVFSLSSLSIVLDLSRNKLSGPLPLEVGKLSNLDILLVHYNKLSGQIPSSLGQCVALQYLYMSKNNFEGSIPDSLQSIEGILELDLSYNNLSGQIPEFLKNFKWLRWLNVSHNRLEGEVPVGGVFSNSSALLLSGNSMLCGGIPELNLRHCNFPALKRSNHKRKFIIIGTLSSVLGVVFLVVFLVFLLPFFKKRDKKSTPFDYSENIPILSYQTLYKATNAFLSENQVGSGTFGVVYRGFLEEYESNVAVKVFKLEYHSALKSFIAECKVLRTIRHRNLLKVITACSSIDHHGRDFKALVYEYMVNRSVEDWLHPNEIEIRRISTRYLNLQQRIEIAIDVASALDYLHHHSIVHCDLKPSNILLDDEMVAHIGDFGLAKILQKGGMYQSSSLGVGGTIGYAPPEYGLGNEASTYGDVYSFGILLLELFTGKRPTDVMFKGDLSLHSYVKKSLAKDTITTILDEVLLKEIDHENLETIKNLKCVLEIGLKCSSEVPQERLKMRDVFLKLSFNKINLSTLPHKEADFKKI